MLVHLAAAWIASLVIGQLAYRVSVVALLLLTALVCAVRRLPRGAALCAIGAAGVFIAHVAVVHQQHCRTQLLQQFASGGAAWLAVDVAAAGADVARGAVEYRAPSLTCTVAVTVRWAGAAPPDGHRVQVRATAQATARGLALRRVEVVAVGPRDVLRATRASAARAIDGLFRTRAPLVRALLIADQDGIPRSVRDRYADAGLVHMLSVSGMHVAIIASALLTMAGLLRIPSRAAQAVALGGVVLYVLVLGCPPPAVRSAVMLVVMALSARWQRPLHDWAPLALGAVVPTIDPPVVTDLGWQLSVGGMAALVAARACRRSARGWAVRTQHHRHTGARALSHWLVTRRGAAGWLVGEISTGVVATVITAPLIAWTFGRLSLIAPLSNVAAGPIVAVLQPALFLALLLAPWPTPAAIVADATQPAMALLDAVADVSGAVPYAVVPVAPTLLTASAAAVASALVIRGTAATRRTPWLVAAASALVLALWLPLVRGGSGDFEMHVIDVGQGDGVALRTPRGRWVLVDAGPRWDGGDAGTRAIIPYLRRMGGPVALFVMSHAHEDHVGGAESLVNAYQPAWWWEPAFVTTSPGYRLALQAVRARGVRWQRVHPGDTWTLDGVTITVLAPDSGWTAAQVNANETSVVLRVSYGAHRFLLTGDAEREEEAWLLEHYEHEALRADVLKLGHHGSRTSSSPPFLDAVEPRVTVASVGTGNRYGHPSPETLAALLAREVPVFRTDRLGSVVLRSNGRTLSVEAGGETWDVPPRAVGLIRAPPTPVVR